MKVNDYVRTDRGYITKISDFEEHYTKGKRLGLKEEVVENFLLLDDKQCEIIESIDYSIPPCYPSDEELEKIKSHIIKSSPNIIDLIEVGDIVELFEEDDIDGEITGYYEVLAYTTDRKEIGVRNKDGEIDWYPSENFRGIITYEQIESMEYKVKE